MTACAIEPSAGHEDGGGGGDRAAPESCALSADGAYAARLASAGDSWFPERWTLDGPEPYAVPLPGNQPEEPGTEVQPMGDGRVLIHRLVGGRHAFALLYPTGPGTGELPLGTVECPTGGTRLRLLPPAPGGDRTEEVQVAQQVLQSLGLRSFTPQVSACPGCGRTTSTFFQEMARDIGEYLREQMPVWRQAHPGVEDLKVAVMGCVVNGPGESKHADIGISLPGTFEEPVAPVFVDGEKTETLRGDDIVPRFLAILEDYVARRYPTPGSAAAAAGVTDGVVPPA